MIESPRIAVVGGGPAGSTCARELAQAGARVDLFEAGPDAEKPCGGGVPAAALREFAELANPKLPRRVVRQVSIYSPSGRLAVVPLEGGIHIFKRRELDSCLRRGAVSAGAVLVPARVTRARRTSAGRWELVTEAGTMGPYDQLIGADGVRGAIRRALAGRFGDDQLTLAIYAYVPGVARCEMALKFFGDFDGYLWIFPRTDHVSVGICARHKHVEAARLEDELHRFVDRHYPEARFSPAQLSGYFIPSSRRPAGPLKGEGWALVGDAAGFVDPLTREGISWAMRSGASLARSTARRASLRTPALPRDLRLAHKHARGFYRRDFLESMTRLVSASPAIRGVMADLFTGRQGYRGLRTRLLANALPCGLQVGLRVLRGPVPGEE